MVVIVIIPIVFGAPAVSIFVPPAVAVLPAVGACFRKFMAPVLGLRTLRAVVIDGLMKLVVRFSGAFLAVVGAHDSCTCKNTATPISAGPDKRKIRISTLLWT